MLTVWVAILTVVPLQAQDTPEPSGTITVAPEGLVIPNHSSFRFGSLIELGIIKGVTQSEIDNYTLSILGENVLNFAEHYELNGDIEVIGTGEATLVITDKTDGQKTNVPVTAIRDLADYNDFLRMIDLGQLLINTPIVYTFGDDIHLDDYVFYMRSGVPDSDGSLLEGIIDVAIDGQKLTMTPLKEGRYTIGWNHKNSISHRIYYFDIISAPTISVNGALELPQGISTSLEQIINAGIVKGIKADDWKSYEVTAPEGQNVVRTNWLEWNEAYEIYGMTEGETVLQFVHKEFNEVWFRLNVNVVKGLGRPLKECFDANTLYLDHPVTLNVDPDIDLNGYYVNPLKDNADFPGEVAVNVDAEAHTITVTPVRAGKTQIRFGHNVYSIYSDGCAFDVQENPTVPAVVEGKVVRLRVNYGCLVSQLVDEYITGITQEELREQYDVESSNESVLEIVARGEAFEGRAIGEAELVFTHKTFPELAFSVPVHVVECTVEADKEELEYGETATLRLVSSDGYEGDDVVWCINDEDNSRYVTLEGNRLNYSSPRLSFTDGQVFVVGYYPGGSLSAGTWIRLRPKDTGYQFTDRFPFIYEGNSQQLAVAQTETIEGMTIPQHTFRLADEEDSEFLSVSPDGMAMALKYPYDYRVILVEAVDGVGNVLCTTEVTILENISHAGNMVKGRIDAVINQDFDISKVLADYFDDHAGNVDDYDFSTDNPDILFTNGFFVYGMNVGEANLTITPKSNPSAAVNIEVTVNESRDFTFSTLEYKYNEDFRRWAYHIKAGETATVALESNLPVGNNWSIEMESGHIGLLDVTKLPGNMIEIKAAENRGGYNLLLINSDDYCNSYGEIYVISYVEEEKPVEMASAEAEVAAGVGVKIPVTLPEEVRGTEVTWSSDNEDVAEVHHHTGVVTTKAFGTATITAHAVETVQGVSLLSRAGEEPVATVTVKVGEIGSFAVPTEMEAGKYADASFTINPAEFGKEGCRWISSRPEIASIDAATGRIHAIAPGTTLIQLTTPVGSRQQVLTVAASDNLPALTLNATDRSVRVGDVFQLIANMEGVTWSSSDRKVAVVDANGLVIVTGHGSAVITAKTADGRTASCRVSTSVVVVGIEDVVAGAEEAVKPVYDLQGRRVARDASELGSLRPGIYIVGGRKVLVR